MFLGGGTPNTYPPDRIVALVALLRRKFALTEASEISIECNPDPQLCLGFTDYRRGGINRISFGVQSFVAAELKTLGRRHSADDAREAVARAKKSGFESISLDLMFGTPGQTRTSLDYSIDAALALDLPHLSIYGLTVEADTPYERWRLREPALFDDDTKDAELYARIIERLSQAGYEHYELSNFARPGHRSLHNGQYWNNDEYIGFGIGAATYRADRRSVQTKEYPAYVEAIERGLPVPEVAEHLSPSARVGEAIMLALRRIDGVNRRAFEARYAVDLNATYAATFTEFAANGLLEIDDSGFRLTHAGKFLANDVCAAFLDPTLRS